VSIRLNEVVARVDEDDGISSSERDAREYRSDPVHVRGASPGKDQFAYSEEDSTDADDAGNGLRSRSTGSRILLVGVDDLADERFRE
jgi:hypothetical protein